ncbi:MAG: glutamate-5-semialdehyde dehydrogenase [Bacteroidetes bacterium]|nr:glutamate-5-semialdehyde dehydrogenase [Bacteroidota bacterium]
MNANLKIDLQTLKQAHKKIAVTTESERNKVLEALTLKLIERKAEIFAANQRDIEKAEKKLISKPLIKRLYFNEEKLTSVVDGIKQIILLPDPKGRVLEARELDEGLILKRESCSIGVIGMIFESRPDALIQIAALCLKSANCIVLKGGSEAAETNRKLAEIISDVSDEFTFATVGSKWIYLLETREQVKEMLELDEFIDLLIPRGSNEFVKYIMSNTTIPVLGHAEGICHSYVHFDADIEKSVRVIVDSKCQYPAVCNALETLLVHSDIAAKFLPELMTALKHEGVEVRGDEESRALIHCKPAVELDWKTEYLDLILSIKIVDSIDAAILHIHTYGSGHTDSILTESIQTAEYFMNTVDSADVLWNCSTRFADGYRYGLGAEVGISTLKIHARGPVGLDGLMSYKWKIYGNGQIVADYTGEGSRQFTHKNLAQE